MGQVDEVLEDLLGFSPDSAINNIFMNNPHRIACYAIRCLLSHELVENNTFADPGDLLKLVGVEMTWPPELEARIFEAVLATTDGKARKQVSLRTLLGKPDRKVWGAYVETVSELYETEPKATLSVFEAKLLELTQSDAETKGLNPTISMLAELLSLSATESKLLAFAEARESFSSLGEFLRRMKGGLDLYFTLVAAAIGKPKKEVQESLRATGSLRSFGLIKVVPKASDLEDFLLLDSVGERLFSEAFSSNEELLGHFMETTPPPTLAGEDFPHLAEEIGLLTTYLARVKADKIKGANILIYGPPGTGKSEFARLLAANSSLMTYEVKSTDEDGDPVPGRQRLVHFAWLQRFLADHEGAMLLFDEVEDAFPDLTESNQQFGNKRRPGRLACQSKAWMNQQLESAAVPSIWISNSIDGIDEAYLRRFAFHLEFRIPPASVRQRIAQKRLEGLPVSEAFITGLASDDTLSPAQIGQAAEFARLCSGYTGQTHEQIMSRGLSASQRAMGRMNKGPYAGGLQDDCNFEYLNLDSRIPPEKLIASLERTGSGSVCFYGLPGTGKTSLARHISTALGKPLMVKRASDLLNMYLGQTEKFIADMFRQAESEGAVLFLDEADSFLRDRKNAHAAWQVTQVNELLQQMEAFQGVFICATNLMDEVDAAALRRFTFKIQFDALTPAQRRRMFADAIFGQPVAEISHAHGTRLDRLSTLTPGDYATVRRQERLLGERYEAEEFLCLLEQEYQAKQGRLSQAIGFVV